MQRNPFVWYLHPTIKKITDFSPKIGDTVIKPVNERQIPCTMARPQINLEKTLHRINKQIKPLSEFAKEGQKKLIKLDKSNFPILCTFPQSPHICYDCVERDVW